MNGANTNRTTRIRNTLSHNAIQPQPTDCHCEERSDEAIFSLRFLPLSPPSLPVIPSVPRGFKSVSCFRLFVFSSIPNPKQVLAIQPQPTDCHCEERSDEAIFSLRFLPLSPPSLPAIPSVPRGFKSVSCFRFFVFSSIPNPKQVLDSDRGSKIQDSSLPA
jgi:AAA+ ATPase superfamily predicted ATPase